MIISQIAATGQNHCGSAGNMSINGFGSTNFDSPETANVTSNWRVHNVGVMYGKIISQFFCY